MLTIKDTAKWLAVKKQIESEAMSQSDRLRLAAELIESGDWQIAESVAIRVVDELWAQRISEARAAQEAVRP